LNLAAILEEGVRLGILRIDRCYMRYINGHSVISAEEVQDRRSQNVRSGVNSARFLLVRFVYGLYGWFICALCTCPCKLL